jgi:hypothetical protein
VVALRRVLPLRTGEPLRFQEGVGSLGHLGVAVQPCPWSAFELVGAQFFLQLLVRLPTDPVCLYGGGEAVQRAVGRWIGEVEVFVPRWRFARQ